MAIEIERKFLVKNNGWRKDASAGIKLIQGYFSTSKHCSIRVRIEGDQAAINIKTATINIKRSEYNYPVPVSDAREMLQNLCGKPLIEKIRYHINYEGYDWEIDEFSGVNQGLIVAEIELDNIKTIFPRPDWLDKEVSGDPRYYNVCLVTCPYREWGK
jgi:adenylate cyclase